MFLGLKGGGSGVKVKRRFCSFLEFRLRDALSSRKKHSGFGLSSGINIECGKFFVQRKVLFFYKAFCLTFILCNFLIRYSAQNSHLKFWGIKWVLLCTAMKILNPLFHGQSEKKPTCKNLAVLGEGVLKPIQGQTERLTLCFTHVE